MAVVLYMKDNLMEATKMALTALDMLLNVLVVRGDNNPSLAAITRQLFELIQRRPVRSRVEAGLKPQKSDRNPTDSCLISLRLPT